MRPLANTVVLSNVIPEYASGGRVLISSSAVGQHDNSAAEAAVRRHLQVLYGLDTTPWTLAASYLVRDALPVVQPSKPLPTAHDVTSGLVVAGDWQQFPSIDGALTSGRRAAAAVLAG
jgi:predicted NAD/FAD-dependent oxidoreductase